MPLFVMFVFGAVILGAGALLSPALPTSQPRIGLAAAFALALIIGGAVFWAMLFGWDTLLIDYMVFFLTSLIFLGGTLSYGQKRAEQRGETLDDADQGWPGPLDLVLLGAAALVFVAIAMLVAPPPPILANPPARAALSADPPGFRALVSYLEHQLGQPMPLTQFAVGAVLAFMCVWLVYDLGAEIKGKSLGRPLMIIPVIAGAFLLLNAQYEILLAAVFALSFAIFALRYTRHQYPIDAFMAGLMLGAALLAQWQVFLFLLFGYAAALGLLALRRIPLRRNAWAMMLLGVPFVAVLATSPWLVWR
jgi:hypothetical protein